MKLFTNKFFKSVLIILLVLSLSIPGLAFNPEFADNIGIAAHAEVMTLNIELTANFRQSEARQMMNNLNAFRTSNTWYWNPDNVSKTEVSGLNTLSYDYGLEKIAMLRALETVIYWDHLRPNGDNVFALMPRGLKMMGENIAAGDYAILNTYDQALTLWREDECTYSGQGHRRNMLNPGFTSIGIACVEYKDVCYWVQVLGGGNTNSAETPALDSAGTDTIEILPSIMQGVSIKVDRNEISLSDTPIPVPKGKVHFNTRETWPSHAIIDADLMLTFSSSDTGIFTVDGEKMHGVSDGTANLTMECAALDFKKEIPVTVKAGSGDSVETSSGAAGGSDVIKVKRPALSKITKVSKGKVKLKWSKIDGADGYQISRSTPSSKKHVIATVNSSSRTYRYVKSKAGKKYYYRVRAFKYVDGKKVYSSWSKYRTKTA